MKRLFAMFSLSMKRSCFPMLVGLFGYLYSGAQSMNSRSMISIKDLPKQLQPFIDQITYQPLGDDEATIRYESIDKKIWKVTLTWTLKDSLKQDDWKIIIYPGYQSTFHWAPHLTPTDDHIIAQHVFRSPALITASAQKQISIIPDLDILKKGQPVAWYMDMNAVNNEMVLGMSLSSVKEHTLFVRKRGALYPAGKLEFGIYIIAEENPADLFDPWRKLDSFFWKKWGSELYAADQPLGRKDLEPYAAYTYNWAFNSWKKAVWQDIDLNGKRVGGTAFIVNVTQSPNYPGKVNEREFRSVWNQAWFSSLRSAGGLYRYARRTGNKELMEYAMKTKELALSFPQKNGFFDALIATEMEKVTEDGKTYNRSKGWGTFYFGNSDRNPFTGDTRKAPYHVLDMSFTASLMLDWYLELEKDPRLLHYATAYGNALIKIQQADGFFPAWLSIEDEKPLDILNQSPETSMSVTFLLKLYQATKNEKYKSAGLKAMQAVMKSDIPVGRWEDFETYWSCSRYGSKELVGKKLERNDMFKQNNFSMYWTAEALLNCYRISKNKNYLKYGQRTLDELLMTQACWQPPYIYVNALGGFGVMNGDGEWNDARQSLFAELILDYGKLLNREEYIERGLSALRASFVMMYCPENARTKEQWEERWNFFGKEDYGFMMENYGHGGETGKKGEGIGEFTIYDWGNGAAAEAYNRILDHYGKAFIFGR
jgi:hypothetical protein